MNSEVYDKLMNPLEKFEKPTPLFYDTEFGEEEREEEMCTWAAKWYLDTYLGDWRKHKDGGIYIGDGLRILLESICPEMFFRTSNMEYCKNILHAVGVTQIDELTDDCAGISFDTLTVRQVGIYFCDHTDKILDKVLEIFDARSKHATAEAEREGENREKFTEKSFIEYARDYDGSGEFYLSDVFDQEACRMIGLQNCCRDRESDEEWLVFDKERFDAECQRVRQALIEKVTSDGDDCVSILKAYNQKIPLIGSIRDAAISILDKDIDLQEFKERALHYVYEKLSGY